MARGGRADSAYVSWVKDKRHTELLRGSGSAPDRTWTATRTLGLHPISRTGSLWLLLKSRVGTQVRPIAYSVLCSPCGWSSEQAGTAETQRGSRG